MTHHISPALARRHNLATRLHELDRIDDLIDRGSGWLEEDPTPATAALVLSEVYSMRVRLTSQDQFYDPDDSYWGELFGCDDTTTTSGRTHVAQIAERLAALDDLAAVAEAIITRAETARRTAAFLAWLILTYRAAMTGLGTQPTEDRRTAALSSTPPPDLLTLAPRAPAALASA